MKTIATMMFALAFTAGMTFGQLRLAPAAGLPPARPEVQPPAPTPQPIQAIYINGIDSPMGSNLTAQVSPQGITIPFAVRLSTGQQVFNLTGLPITYSVNSPRLAAGDFGYEIHPQTGAVRVFSFKPGPVMLTLKAPTTFLGSPSIMYSEVVINFYDFLPLAGPNTPLLVVANTQKATYGQTASQTVVLPPAIYPAGDYHLYVLNDKGGVASDIPLGPVVQPGQAIPIPGHQVLAYDRGGWMYTRYQLADFSRPGLPVGFGAGYVNVKSAGFRNLDARVDDAGNILLDVNSGNFNDTYSAYLVTTDGFAVELPLAPVVAKTGGVRLTFYKGSMIDGPLFTPGEYTPVVVERIADSNGSLLVHSLPNAIHLDGDNIPFFQ